jgi:HSP20 family molecular chaperone IbpA
MHVHTLHPRNRTCYSLRIHSVVEVSPGSVTTILSSRHYTELEASGLTKSRRSPHEVTKFDIWAARFSLPLNTPQDATPQPMDILWHRRGDYAPISIEYDTSRRAHLLIGGSIYRSVNSPVPLSYDPSQDEFAPIPRPGEDLDMVENGPTKPPPYSWTQTNDEVTLAFPLPYTTDKSHINVSFSSRTLTVRVHRDQSPSSISTATHVPPLLLLSMKQLWDGIQPSTSFWTWDRAAEHSFGLLTLHLDKQNDGTRWIQVFASAGTSNNAQDDTDVEVPETLDPSELYNIRESLEKYTSSLRDGDDASGLGLGKGVPSLGQGEIDDEVDMAIGRQAYITWVTDGPSTADGGSNTVPDTDDEVPFNLLSTTVPGFKPSEISLVIKNSLDGIVFSLPPACVTSSAPTWTHTSTFPALAFVLASKQDTRFTYHVPSKAVLAFDNGVRDRGGNVYVYRSSKAAKEKWAKQVVLKVGDGSGGSLLGVGVLKMSQGGHVLLCLCEGELVMINIQNIL